MYYIFTATYILPNSLHAGLPIRQFMGNSAQLKFNLCISGFLQHIITLIITLNMYSCVPCMPDLCCYLFLQCLLL